MAISPTAREATLPASSVKDQTAALFLEGATAAGLVPRSELAEGPQAQLRPGADDDVVMHGDPERLGDVDDRFRHLDVGLRRRRIAGGMVVQESAMID